LKIARIVFYIEVLLNLSSAILSFFIPATFLSLFSSQSSGAAPLEMLRWYGVLLLVLVYVELRALLSGNNQFLAIVLEGLLLGDLVQLVCIYLFGTNSGEWTASLIFTIFTTVSLAAVRIFWLWLYYRKPARN
jgi:hypothetical protein